MPTARNNWIAQQTGYTGAWGGGAFQRWKAKQGGKIAATDWTAASMRWQSMQPKRTLPKKAVAAPIAPKTPAPTSKTLDRYKLDLQNRIAQQVEVARRAALSPAQRMMEAQAASAKYRGMSPLSRRLAKTREAKLNKGKTKAPKLPSTLQNIPLGNLWTAAHTGYTGEFKNGDFARWKLKQGGKIASTDWRAASKKAVDNMVAGSTWRDAGATQAGRIAAYRATHSITTKGYSDAQIARQMLYTNQHNGAPGLSYAIDNYNLNPTRATALALKTQVKIQMGSQNRMSSRVPGIRRKAAALKASAEVTARAGAAMSDAFSKGFVARDKGGFFNDVISFGKNIALPAAAAFGGLVTGVGALGALTAASAPTAASAGGGLLSIPATDLTSLATGGAVTQAGGYAGSALAPTVTGMTSAGLGSAGTALAAGATGAASAGGGLLSTVSNLLPSNLTGVDIAKGAAGAASSLINANTASKNNQAALQNTQAQINANAAQQQTTINANAIGNIGNTTAGLNGGTNAMPTLSGSNPYLALLK